MIVKKFLYISITGKIPCLWKVSVTAEKFFDWKSSMTVAKLLDCGKIP